MSLKCAQISGIYTEAPGVSPAYLEVTYIYGMYVKSWQKFIVGFFILVFCLSENCSLLLNGHLTTSAFSSHRSDSSLHIRKMSFFHSEFSFFLTMSTTHIIWNANLGLTRNFPALLAECFMCARSVRLAKLFVLHEHGNCVFVFPHRAEQNFAKSSPQVSIFNGMCCGHVTRRPWTHGHRSSSL